MQDFQPLSQLFHLKLVEARLEQSVPPQTGESPEILFLLMAEPLLGLIQWPDLRARWRLATDVMLVELSEKYH